MVAQQGDPLSVLRAFHAFTAGCEGTPGEALAEDILTTPAANNDHGGLCQTPRWPSGRWNCNIPASNLRCPRRAIA